MCSRSRPDSAFSIGVNQVFLSGKYRDNAIDAGLGLRRSESAIEVTYSDKIGPVTIQPDLQYVKDPGADGGVGHALVAILRVGVEFRLHPFQDQALAASATASAVMPNSL
ncbi:carbohydrate porin [Caulobacter sp. UC70_42]|uniref:carbohydrate porin n=1 Tax=Caulobacter sp. UC70_42 TaxID=3374551 RepID=UPI00375744E7